MTDPAPLFSAPGGPAPPAGQAEWVEGAGGLRLRAALFPAPRPRGTVMLSGGRTEFIEKYYEVIGELIERGFCVLTHDWRGQGLSGRLLANPLKGHAAGFDDFVADYGRLLDRFEARLPSPIVALSHSMGGGVTALVLTGGERRISGAVLSSPMIGLAADRGPLTRFAVGAVAAVIPGVCYPLGKTGDPLSEPFEGNVVTHDRAHFERYRAYVQAHPELALGAVTWGWIASAFTAGRRLADPRRAAGARLPLTIVAAGEERLVSNAASRAFAEATPQGRFMLIEGARHELLMETDAIRAVFWGAFDEFAAKVAPPA